MRDKFSFIDKFIYTNLTPVKFHLNVGRTDIGVRSKADNVVIYIYICWNVEISFIYRTDNNVTQVSWLYWLLSKQYIPVEVYTNLENNDTNIPTVTSMKNWLMNLLYIHVICNAKRHFQKAIKIKLQESFQQYRHKLVRTPLSKVGGNKLRTEGFLHQRWGFACWKRNSLPRPRRVLRGIVFTRSVCVSVCVCVCVSGQYFGILFLGY